MLNREKYASLILARLQEELPRLRDQFPQNVVQSCCLDNLLPRDLALEIVGFFPDKSTMTLKKSLRENRYVAAQMNQYAPILEEIVYAFQDPASSRWLGRLQASTEWFRTTACTLEGSASWRTATS